MSPVNAIIGHIPLVQETHSLSHIYDHPMVKYMDYIYMFILDPYYQIS